MKAFTTVIFTSIMVSVSLIVSPACTYGEPLVGVKEGDWMEYKVNITGVPPNTQRYLDENGGFAG
jgi:hypothetical protein